MLSNKKEVQKKNEMKGSNSPKFALKINSMREESHDQDSNEQGSTTITEETKKNEKKNMDIKTNKSKKNLKMIIFLNKYSFLDISINFFLIIL